MNTNPNNHNPKRFAYESQLIEMNRQWWNEQVENTIDELNELIENNKYSNQKENRIKFLENRLAYLEKKGAFENRNIRKLQSRVRKFYQNQ